jgi:hypothetical protein
MRNEEAAGRKPDRDAAILAKPAEQTLKHQRE